jgi:hypothetical protein
MVSPGKIRKQTTSMSGTRSPGLRIELLRQARDSAREVKKVRWRHLLYGPRFGLSIKALRLRPAAGIPLITNSGIFFPPVGTWRHGDSSIAVIVLGLFLRHGAEVDFFSTQHLPQLTHQPLLHESPSVSVLPTPSHESLGAHEALVRLARLHLGLTPAQLIPYPFISELCRLYGSVLPGFT